MKGMKAVVSGAACGPPIAAAVPAQATEGGIDRPITGMQVTPYAGAVPPASGWIVSLTAIYYQGSFGASKAVPIAGTITAGLDYSIVYVQADVGGWIQQLSDDAGRLADAPDGGLKGHSVGIGPIVTRAGKVSKTPVSAALRWVNEFEAHARPRGNAVQLSVSATFE